LVVGQVKRKAPMASLPCSSIGRNGGRGPECPGGRASQPERPGRQVARHVSTLWSCDEPSLILRKSELRKNTECVQSTGLLHLLRAGLS
jgi:hypothetical protein